MKRKCEGRRRMWRRHAWGVHKCGRNATYRVETRVGTTQNHYVCDDAECFASVAGGYPAQSFPLAKESK